MPLTANVVLALNIMFSFDCYGYLKYIQYKYYIWFIIDS
jgi:hypothetical protein